MNMNPCNNSLFEFSRLNLATSFVNILCFYKTSKRVKTNQTTTEDTEDAEDEKTGHGA